CSSQGGRQRLAFARRHLSHAAIEQDPPAENLHIIVPLANRPLCHLTHQGKGPEHQLVAEALAPEPLPYSNDFFAQLIITQGRQRAPLFVHRLHHLSPHRRTLPQPPHDRARELGPLLIEPALAWHRPFRISAVQRHLLPGPIKHGIATRRVVVPADTTVP